MAGARRGRRPGAPDTRAAILAAARSQFASHGVAGATIRGIAGEAGVDAALVHHYFGSKDDLFMAAMELPVDPRQVLAPVIAAGPEGAAERFLRALLEAWDDPDLQPTLVGFVRGVLEPGGARLLAEGFLPVVIEPVGRALGLDRPEHRMPLVASQVIGIVMLRYVLRVEPLASMPRERLVATYAPTVQRYLTGPLP
ncbi:TetR family transcriptional regulator [Nocardioides coralli]|uniref:TetR/AcrR family transcriptional regulator n=1 Tax=Nocardioides coralli TaxID=2872154 RepID=UPI001CA3D979|nr:TetR family transcriptional regulator [Nocardioides coralli]QZY29440.1 TetR family transcriptional regulator [Nocardioides coralli]